MKPRELKVPVRLLKSLEVATRPWRGSLRYEQFIDKIQEEVAQLRPQGRTRVWVIVQEPGHLWQVFATREGCIKEVNKIIGTNLLSISGKPGMVCKFGRGKNLVPESITIMCAEVK